MGAELSYLSRVLGGELEVNEGLCHFGMTFQVICLLFWGGPGAGGGLSDIGAHTR